MPNIRIKINCKHFSQGSGKCNKLPKKRFLLWQRRQKCVRLWDRIFCELQSNYHKPPPPPSPCPPSKPKRVEVVVFNGGSIE